MKKAFFITGTDTNVGKTHTTLALLHYFNQQSLKTAALKPIASGAEQTPNGLRNADAQQLHAAMSMNFTYEQINPWTFELAVAPHLAAAPKILDVKSTLATCQDILHSAYDVLFIEGAGGWIAPLNLQETFADLATAFGFPIILVVGLKLGCLNHAILTWENIKSRGLPIAGWIANQIDPHMQQLSENIATLETMLHEPPLAIIPHGKSVKWIRDI